MQRDRRGRSGHKDLQVCRQVFDALTYALAELDDPMIEVLSLAAVTPAPSSARVMITLVPSRDGIDAAAALERLRGVMPALRAEVASELTRKRVPELVFRIGYLDDATV
jgi:ribosome-binding factor A